MRKILLLISIACMCFKAQAQINYLYNPSFEQNWGCPTWGDEVKLAKYWSPINDTLLAPLDSLGPGNCSPDLCNTCCTNINVSIPVNFRFNHNTRTGNAMVQVQSYFNEFDSTFLYKRDYLQGRLKQALQPGVQYCITFYVCLDGASGYGINHMGAYFDDGTMDTTNNCGFPQVAYVPQIIENAIITDKINWTKIQGIITGTGTEKFMTIGNFYDAAHTDTIAVVPTISGSYLSWFLVDDISVIEIDSVANAGHDTTILAGDTAWIGNHDDYLPCKWYLAATGAFIDSNHAGLAVHPSMTTSYVMELDVCGTLSYDTVTVTIVPTWAASPRPASADREVLLPNPARDIVTVSGILAPTDYKIVNSIGTSIQSGTLDKNNNTIALSDIPSGMYIIQLTHLSGTRNNMRLIKE